jgi:ferredoxin-NADP reductase
VHRILSKEVLAPDVVRFWIEGPHIARKRKPGQFVIVRTGEDGERIPLTIADVDKSRGAISIIVQGVGKSTRQLNALNEGDTILAVAGPLVVFVGGAAAPDFRWRELVVFAVVVTAGCVALFRYALGLPIPVLVVPGLLTI